jgi:hypothetical protein
MKTLYHYCSVEAFFNIVQSRKIRLTCISNLNDQNEVSWTTRKVKATLNYLASNHSRSDVAMLREQILTSKITPYLCALSEERDQLGQWRAYAGDGTGVAIGFNKDYLPANDQVPLRNVSLDSNLSLRKVVYPDKSYDRELESILSAALDAMKDKDEKEKFAISTQISHQVFGMSTFFKHPAFAEEREWRLVHTPSILANAKNETIVRGAISDIRQCVADNRIQTFFEYDLAEEKAVAPIAEIVLGPKCQISHYDMSIFLSLNGCTTTKVANSKASYR